MNKKNVMDWEHYKVDVSMSRVNDENINLQVVYAVAELGVNVDDNTCIVIDFLSSFCREERDGKERKSLIHTLGSAMFPLELIVSCNLELIGVKNWKESLRRIKRAFSEFHNSSIADYLKEVLSELTDEAAFIRILSKNTFFQLMFCNCVGGDRLHILYNYPCPGDALPFMYEDFDMTRVCEPSQSYRAKLCRISDFAEKYSGRGKFTYKYSSKGLPESVDASFLLESDEIGYFKKEVHIKKE